MRLEPPNGARRALRPMSLLVAFLALDAAAAGRTPILHEPLPPLHAGSGARTDRIVQSAASDALPGAIETAAGTIEKPKPSVKGDETAQYSPRPPPQVGIDRRTGADGELHYRMVFDPAIAPFKREIAFDSMNANMTLAVSGAGLQPLPPAARSARTGHELFWGHVRVAVRKGEKSVLPSVAPTSQVLQWQAIPPIALTFWRDAAGNFAVSGEVTADVDLRFLMDAPAEYFAAPLGVRGRNDDPVMPNLLPEIQTRARAMWPAIGVAAKDERAQTLVRLTEWFRGFEPGEPPVASGDALADLVLGRKGVCRHRALGFFVIARSLGIPVHYVMNEAHAFIEVWTPLQSGRGGWQRVDLGGGAQSLELHATQDKHLHTPQFGDPFPRPPTYANENGQVIVDGQPLNRPMAGAKQVKGLQKLKKAPDAPAGGSGGAAESAQQTDTPANQTPAEARQAWLRDRAARMAAPVETPRFGPQPAEKHAQPIEVRRASQTTLQAAAEAWIDEAFAVTGQLRCAGGNVGHQAIELWLIDPRQPLAGHLVGMAVTDPLGLFATNLGLPSDLDLQTYDLIARFPGSAKILPSDSTML